MQLDIVYLYYGAVHHLRPSSLFDSFQQRGKNTIRGCRRNHLISEPWFLMAAEQSPVVFRMYAVTEFKIDDEEHLIVEGEDILGVVEG